MQESGIGDTGKISQAGTVTKSSNLHPSRQHASAADAAPDIRETYAALVRQAAAGDEQAMEQLLVRAQEVAYRVSLLVCGHADDAEDVMQEALLKTYQFVRRIEEPEAFRTWLYKTVRNACLMKRRRRAGEPAHHVSVEQGSAAGDEAAPVEVADPSRAAEQQLIDAWIGERLRRALQRLPRTYRAIVVLREIEGLSTREVAAITHLSEANVKTRLHRARRMLRESLGDL
jgi:RNA polymerase sigma-70 factor (ECF subfamily)